MSLEEPVDGMVLLAFMTGPLVLDKVDWFICVELVVVVLAALLLLDELPFSVKRISGEIIF
jgi:hypothetical protein